jgi:hypothetical protein
MHELATLLQETGLAHHQAFIATNGFDPEWALWYAEYLEDKLPTHLGRELTRSEIVYNLIAAQKAQEEEESTEPWPQYYARYLGGN